MSRRRGDRGVTLLELTVALALFGLVATMATQALLGTLRSREELTERALDNAALVRALTRLRHDLEAAAPLPPALSLQPGGAPGLALTLAGQPTLSDPMRRTGVARVVWHLDPAAGTLIRRMPPGPAVPMLTGIETLTAEVFGDDGWAPVWAPDTPAALPRAIRIRLGSRRHGPLELVERF